MEFETMKELNYVAQPTSISLNINSVISTCLLFISFVLLLYFTSSRKLKKSTSLNLLPGPKGLPIVGNILDVSSYTNSIDLMLKFGKLYPDCYLLSVFNQHVVFITSGTVARYLLKSSKFGHTFKDDRLTSMAAPYLNYGVASANGLVYWKNERKLLLPTMSVQSIRNYLKPVDTTSKLLVTELRKMFEDGNCHAVSELVNACVISHTAEMISGSRVDDLDECLEHHHSFKRLVALLFHRLDRPWLWVDCVFRFHHTAKELSEVVKVLNTFMQKRLNEAKLRRKKLEIDPEMSRCMLDALFDAEIPEYLILEEVKMLTLAGYETMGSTINFTLWMLGLHPEHQELCRKEVDEMFAKIDATNDELSLEDLNSLKYLGMCISESLRLFPVASSIARNLREPLTIVYKEQPIEIPAGVNVVLDFISVHRNPIHYPNPTKYDPNRFTPEEIAKRPPHTFIPFSSGVRGCIGTVYAMAAVKLSIAHILRQFSWSTTETMESVRILPGVNIRPEHDIKFLFCKREALV